MLSCYAVGNIMWKHWQTPSDALKHFSRQNGMVCKGLVCLSCDRHPCIYITDLFKRGAVFTVRQVCSCFNVRMSKKEISPSLDPPNFGELKKQSNDIHQVILEPLILIYWLDRSLSAGGSWSGCFSATQIENLEIIPYQNWSTYKKKTACSSVTPDFF